MENHPIPQDVTGFQFKLIGNMTVKQFAYLAVGIIIAGVLWASHLNFLIKFPFCILFAILGAALAYFPISGRPMDTMIGKYIEALVSPTQFIYEKTGGQIYFPNRMSFVAKKNIKQYGNSLSPFPKDKLKAYLESLGTQPKNKVDEKENNFLMSVSSLAAGNANYQPIVTPSENVNPQPLNPIRQIDSPITIDALRETDAALQPTSTARPVQPTIINAKSMPAPQAQEQMKAAKPLLKGPNRIINMPGVPVYPNLITGITKDARGNALSNILVEVKDKDNNPVRAFKTNEFGRFASATPLTNGTYSVEFEDPRAQNKFEKIAINVTGQIIIPIEANSVDEREELRRSLFSASASVPQEGQTN